MVERRTWAERGAAVVGLTLAVAAGNAACSREAPPQTPPNVPGAVAALFRGTVINYLDHTGANVGVRTYRGPNDVAEAGFQEGNARPYADCIAPGRKVVDGDVPAGVVPTESDNWYRLVADQDGTPMNAEWIGDGYFHVQTPGTVPTCSPDQIVNK